MRGVRRRSDGIDERLSKYISAYLASWEARLRRRAAAAISRGDVSLSLASPAPPPSPCLPKARDACDFRLAADARGTKGDGPAPLPKTSSLSSSLSADAANARRLASVCSACVAFAVDTRNFSLVSAVCESVHGWWPGVRTRPRPPSRVACIPSRGWKQAANETKHLPTQTLFAHQLQADGLSQRKTRHRAHDAVVVLTTDTAAFGTCPAAP